MKKILIISEYIAPVQEIASVRWTKIAKYLQKYHDVEITILTNKKNFSKEHSVVPISKKDPLLTKDLNAFNHYWIVGYSRSYIFCCTVKKYLKKFKKKQVFHSDKIEKDINKIHNQRKTKGGIKEDILEIWKDILSFIWYRRSMSFLKNKKLDFDVIISTYSPAWTHLAAEKIKEKNPNFFWIADFRDPYAKDLNGMWSFRYHKNFVKKHCAKANVITRVNDKMNLFEKKEQKVVTIHNGYDLDEACIPIAPQKFNLVFTGFLYRERSDLSEAFHAIYELIQEDLIKLEDIVLEYAGITGEIFLQQAAQWNLQDRVIDYGLVKRTKAIEMQQKSAILLQASWNTKLEKTEWSGKMYEYMMAKKPIVYLMTGEEPYSLPSKLMPKVGGVCYEECRHKETFPIIKNYILGKYQEWKRTGNVTIEAEEDYISQFAYSKIAEKVWDLIK